MASVLDGQSNQSVGNVTNNIRNYGKFEALALVKKDKVVKDSKSKIVTPKMTNFQAFFALAKSYCAINVLLTPKQFRNGGYLLSPIALGCSAVI